MLLLSAIIASGFMMNEPVEIPVAGATTRDWNAKTFWHYPWGKSYVHKGIDIFSKAGTRVVAATDSLIINTSSNKYGGTYILALGPKWRLHYYAHLKSTETKVGDFVRAGEAIATLGRSGNAATRPPHLHYSISRILPNPWAAEPQARHGEQKASYINPDAYLRKQHAEPSFIKAEHLAWLFNRSEQSSDQKLASSAP